MIVVTGAAGFIGSCLVSRLNARGKKDLILVDHFDDESDLKHHNLTGKKFNRFEEKAKFLEAIDKDRIQDPIELVVHLGACSSTTLQDADYFEQNNFLYSCHMAQWSLSKGARFIYASSAATYGDGTAGYTDNPAIIKHLRPLNLYGLSKQKFDEWILDQQMIDKVVGLKFFNVFGPNEYHKADMRSVIAKAYERVMKDGKIALFKSYKREYADGEQKRDFIYVKDAVDVVEFFIDHCALAGIYNVGTGQARTWNDLARALFAAVGKKPCIEYIDMPEVLKPRYQYCTQADVGNLRKAGFTQSFMPLEDSVKDYVRYLKGKLYY